MSTLQNTDGVVSFEYSHWYRISSANSNVARHCKQYHKKVLLSSFHLNGHTIGFHPQTRMLEPQ